MKFVIVRTGGGTFYSRRIGQELNALGYEYRIPPYHSFGITLRNWGCTKDNTALHTRAAYPSRHSWMADLFDLDKAGWKIFNKPEAIWLTSNKLECALRLVAAGLSHPATRQLHSREEARDFLRTHGTNVVFKPLTSNGNGIYIQRVLKTATGPEVGNAFDAVPDSVMGQVEVPYDAIYRVVVLDGEPMTTVWSDKPAPGKWKVSVCINPRMGVTHHAPNALLDLAVKSQELVGGKINFVDIFRTPDGGYQISEINTACNLKHHERLSGINVANHIARTLVKLSGAGSGKKGGVNFGVSSQTDGGKPHKIAITEDP